jgi:glycogen debranching enzyme
MDKVRSLFEAFEYAPVENPDWGFARNVRAALVTPSAEWVQSVCSFPFDVNGKTFITPNRDYPYEGLVAYHAGENWKFIDCIGLSLLRQNGDHLPLIASTVRITPWEVQYRYGGGIPVLVSYYLDSQNSPERLTGCVEFNFPRGLNYDNDRVVALIQPFVDIRHMYGSSSFGDYRITNEFESYRRIHISNHNRVLTFFSPTGRLSVFDSPEIVDWQYKLGTGSRTEQYDQQQQETVFIGERKNVAAFFGLQVSTLEQNSVKLYFSTSLNTAKTNFFLTEMQRNSDESKRKDQSEIQAIIDTFPVPERISFREEIWARIIALIKFKTYIYFAEAGKYIRVPHAGAWWFKTPWYRDVFEGLLNSFETLMRLPREREDIREVILSALSLQHKPSGLIQNKIPEFTTHQVPYNSCDATLLCFMVANAYFRKTKDPDFASSVLACVGAAVSSFKSNGKHDASSFGVDGPPRADEATGLLLCAPHHSWIDTRTRSVQCAGGTLSRLPNRLSEQFLKKLCDRTVNKANIEAIASSPSFFLPEINAQWISVLEGTIQMIDLMTRDRSDSLFADLRLGVEAWLTRAKKHFKTVFWNKNNGYLFNAVLEDGALKDDIECEAGVTAAAILGESVFTHDELQSIWHCINQTLLRHRRLVKHGNEVLPFGIITKNENQGIFYGDDQYHSDMIWPRSTPYLIKLLRTLNRHDTARDILLNNLDHQMTECAIFYNQELFSPALGHNAHPNGTTSQNPVPVKNPIQFWSQWCDAYLEIFGEEELLG